MPPWGGLALAALAGLFALRRQRSGREMLASSSAATAATKATTTLNPVLTAASTQLPASGSGALLGGRVVAAAPLFSYAVNRTAPAKPRRGSVAVALQQGRPGL